MKNAVDLIKICKEKSLTVSSCESLTAGLFLSTIASNPGASSILKGGLVTYFTEMKKVLANVSEDVTDIYGVISSECAKEMAVNTLKITGSDYCVSFTGNAGPDTMENKPAGCVYCAIASKDEVRPFYFQFDNLSRNELRQEVVDKMIDHLVCIIKKE